MYKYNSYHNWLLSSIKLGERFREFDFHLVKPRKADCTDDGPGISVTNTDVKFRDAEITVIHNPDYCIRCHRSRDDSGQGRQTGLILPW